MFSSRGGSNNAYTASTYTNFHFDIPKEHFLDAMDRYEIIQDQKWSEGRTIVIPPLGDLGGGDKLSNKFRIKLV